MASEAKGQIGGLDMNEEARTKLAKQSRTWKCTGCGGRSNEEVIEECKAKWREQHEGEEGELARQGPEMQIPEELRLAYKDDMERGPPTPNIKSVAGSSGPRSPSDIGQAPARAGAVAGVLARPKPPPSPLRMTATARGLERGTDTSRVPPATSNLRFGGQLSSTLPTARTPATVNTAPSPPGAPNDIVSRSAVPKWLDLAIIGVAVGIVFMLTRKFFI